jgi:outer membrane receptor protein involved in Fe transport
MTYKLSVERTHTFKSKSRLIAGYDLERTEGLFDLRQTVASPDDQSRVVDADGSSHLRHAQSIHALYASFEHPLGAWTMLAGLRFEQAEIDAATDYFRVYPSLHVIDKLDEHQSLTFSYSRRVERPFWQDLNPDVVRRDDTSFRQGNPDLAPSEVDSLEGGWSWEDGHSSLSATAYLRRSHDNVTYITTPISETAVMTRPENLGQSQSGGLELVAAGRLLTGLDATLSGNAYYNEIDASNLGFEGTRSTVGYEAKAALNWRMTARNRMQINIETTGKQLTPQGYRQGSTAVDFGYRFQLRPNFAWVATVSDLLASRRSRVVLDTPSISSSSTSRQPGRIVFVGVSWSMTEDKNVERFEYDK